MKLTRLTTNQSSTSRTTLRGKNAFVCQRLSGLAATNTLAEGLLEKLNSDSKSQAPPSPRFEFRDRSTFAVNPSTERLYFIHHSRKLLVLLTPDSVISRVQAFLPQIQASNEALIERVRDDPDGTCIEYIENADEYIEMVSFHITSLVKFLTVLS